MIRRLVWFALHQQLFLVMLTVLFVAGGIVAFRALPIEAFPDVTDVQATVITLLPGRAPEEVEKQVTIPLEIQLSGLPYAVRMFSHTQFGLSFIVLTFDDRANAYFARQQVLERLRGVELPPGVEPQLAPLSTAIGEIYRYRVKGGNLNTSDLRTLQDWVVARRLKAIPGVAEIVTMGGFIKQYQVNVDNAVMKAYGVSLQQLFTALGRGSANAGGSYFETDEQQYVIRGIGLFRSSDDIGNVVVTERNGTPLLIKDIAEVSVGAVPRQGTVGQDDIEEIVSGIVLMRKGENPSEVLAAVKEKVEELNATGLPKGVQIAPFYDRTWLIERTLKTVFTNLLEGAALVALVLYLFLGHLKSAAIVAIVIPLSLLGTFIGLQLRGIPANLLSLGAMDFGIIVDGAVIVVENIFRRLSEKRPSRDYTSFKTVILEAACEVGRPTFFSMLIIIIAHIPIFALQRHEGRIFAPMAYTIVSALVGSLLFSLTLVPLLCLRFLRGALPEHDNLLVTTCKRLYRPVLVYALNRKKAVLISAVALLAVTISFMPFLGTEFLPELNEGTVWVNVMLPPGISVSEVSKENARIRKILGGFPEVRSVISKAGRPEDGTDPKMINMSEFFVDVKPEVEWTRKITKRQLLDQMQQALEKIPGLKPSFSQPIRDNILESISQIDGQIVIKVFGEDVAILRDKAEAVLRTVAPIQGVARAFVDRAGQVPQLQIEIDRARAARYGLNIADIQDVVETAVGGKEASEIWEGEKRFRVVVRLREEQRRDIASIRNLLVDAPSGLRVPLEQVANIAVGMGSLNIARESGIRVAAIGVFIRDRDMGSIVAEMQEKVKARVELPPGYRINFGGEFENQQRAMKRLAVIVPVTIFLIFVLLFDTFKSVKSALLIILNIPFALIGGVFALLATDINLSVSAAIGFIALSGQAVLNGVVMVSYFNELRDEGVTMWEAVLEGSVVRLRAILMTAVLAMLGLLPMALSHGIGSEVQKPLAVVIIGGLISATLLTLIVLPTLYLWIEGDGHREPAPAPAHARPG
jgi:cobalt-zinc-cadmium resistance protein CzcA